MKWLFFSRAKYTFPNLPLPSGRPISKSSIVRGRLIRKQGQVSASLLVFFCPFPPDPKLGLPDFLSSPFQDPHATPGLGTHVKLDPPLLLSTAFWPGAAKESTGKLRSSHTPPLYTVLSLAQLPAGWPLGRLMRTAAEGVVASFRRTLWDRVFRPD